MYELTAEQQDIINTVTTLPEGSLLKVEAVAGAAKTYTLIQIAKALHGANCLYLAYNKSIATEASSVFPRYVECKTTHSLAYNPIITHSLNLDGMPTTPKREVGIFNHRSIEENITYDEKCFIVDHLEEFFLSKHTDILAYFKEKELDSAKLLSQLMDKYFTKMVNKETPCTHSFYLKLYHILLADECIHYNKPFDLLMLDEAGDINAVTLEIFMLLPAKIKVMVGDSLQNIYSFNNTINGFKALKGVGVTKHLSQSFRCSTQIASKIEDFCIRHLDEDTVFLGTDHKDTTIRSEAILSRTNSGLIRYMVELSDANIKFNLTRSPADIFSTMLILMNLKSDMKVYDARYKHLVDDVKNYYKSASLKSRYRTPLGYIKALHESEDANIKAAIATILKYGNKSIYSAYNFAKKCADSKDKHNLTLSTAHSSKGLTFDSVTIADDFDLTDILEAPSNTRTDLEIESLRLYYVSCSRARLELNNAIFLDK